ncbi:unnamed protein product [Mesocestoides corti]|uniref:Enoyl reductase (ER) domain-containing protein n=1 Tax=Mesocestoides corti TaxID=53468 RepID=A0A158QS52_MESCO|nr:unnamed protein product [Mesocestoides corti]
MPEEAEATNQPATEEETPKLGEKEAEKESPSTNSVKQARCVVLTGFGGPKYVRVQPKDQKAVGKGEIAIDVEACGVGFQDLMTRQGFLEFLGRPPFVMGSECSGKVAEVGEGVTEFKIGDEVLVLCDSGAWTEYLVVKPITEGSAEGVQAETSATGAPAALVFHKPTGLSTSQAASFLMSYLPAYLLLHKVAYVRPGDIVLVHSAGGGVGTAIGQLAKYIQNVKMIGIASAAKHEKLQQYYSLLINSSQDYAAEVKKYGLYNIYKDFFTPCFPSLISLMCYTDLWNSYHSQTAFNKLLLFLREFPQGITVVLDSRSGEETNKVLSLLQPLGRYIIYGNSSFVTGERKNLFTFAKSWIQMDRISPLKLLEENKLLGGFSLKQMVFHQQGHFAVIFEAWKELKQMLLENKIEPVVDSEWSFEEVREALHKLQDRKNLGKVVISPKLKPKELDQRILCFSLQEFAFTSPKVGLDVSAMQTQISAEEFARFQSQLLELRQQKYAADESRIRADRRADDLEKTLALQSGEIAELRSSLSRIQRAGDIDALFKENQSLRHRLINIESSFQLQTSTLRAECERLQADNSVLLSTLKTAGLNQTTATSSAHDEGTQTIPIIQTVKASQTLKSGQTSSQVQTDLLSADIENVENRLNELSEADTLLANERLASGRLVKELLERELDVERLERDCEALRSELVVMEKRSDRVQKDLKRQLASAVRAAKQATATPSLSSLVYVQKPPQKCDTISVESFSLCGGVNGVQVMGNDGDMSETSSSSPIPQQTLFSEDDLKGLLNRLSEVQEENCNLRHKVKRLEADLDAKSTIIQQRLTDKAIPYPPGECDFCSLSNAALASDTVGIQHCVQTNADSSKATPVTNPHSLIPRLASDVLSTVKSKLKQLEAVTMEMSSPTTAVSSVELLGLKRLCEELMTRNISLERALEIALSSGKGNEEI